MSIQVAIEDPDNRLKYTVIVINPDSDLQHTVKLAAREPIAYLLPPLIAALNLPSIDDKGNHLRYYLNHNGRRLGEQETLISAKVQPGDTLNFRIMDSRTSSTQLIRAIEAPAHLVEERQHSPLPDEKISSLAGIAEALERAFDEFRSRTQQGSPLSTLPNEQLTQPSIERNSLLSFMKNQLAGTYLARGESRDHIEYIESKVAKTPDKGEGIPPRKGKYIAIGGEKPNGIEVLFEDSDGNKLQRAWIYIWVSIEHIIREVIVKLQLSVTDEAGHPTTYYLMHTGIQLQEQETLADAGVRNADTIVIKSVLKDFEDVGYYNFAGQPPHQLHDTIPAGFSLRPFSFRHWGQVNKIVWSPDGTILASLSVDGAVWLWRSETGKLERILTQHVTRNTGLTWSHDSTMLATIDEDSTIWLWDTRSGRHLRTLQENPEEELTIGLSLDEANIPRASTHGVSERGGVANIAWSPDGTMLASFRGRTIWLWDIKTGLCLQKFTDHTQMITALAWSPKANVFATGSRDQSVRLWDAQRRQLLLPLVDLGGAISSLSWSSNGRHLAIATADYAIQIWDIAERRQVRILQGHTGIVVATTFSADGLLFATQTFEGAFRLWRTDTWQTTADIQKLLSTGWSTFAFNPRTSPSTYTLATPGEKVIYMWDIDMPTLSGDTQPNTLVPYANAKVVLVGETTVGKTCLTDVLTGKIFTPTASSNEPRRVLTFSHEVNELYKETREILLWDLAGQQGYRLIQQLSLGEATLALVVFDPGRETDPTAGIGYWCSALNNAQSLRANTPLPLKKFLVAARIDVSGSVGINRERMQHLIQKGNFADYFKTSAQDGTGIEELRKAIQEAIPWEMLPRVTVTDLKLFYKMKEFLLSEKNAGRLLQRSGDLREAFLRLEKDFDGEADFRKRFDACMKTLESQGIAYRFSFNNLLLLQPELLDTYASAIINEAKDQADETGTIAVEKVRKTDFLPDKKWRLKNRDDEELLLIAVIEDLVTHELAFLEIIDGIQHLVFPSQCMRTHPDMPHPEGQRMIYRFEGSIIKIYTTLIVRLTYSNTFMFQSKEGLWKNAATYTHILKGKYGIFLEELGDNQGTLTLFFQEEIEAMRNVFDELVFNHLQRTAMKVQRQRVFICTRIHPTTKTPCNYRVPDDAIEYRLLEGYTWVRCLKCDHKISLADEQEQPVDVTDIALPTDTVEDEIEREKKHTVKGISNKGMHQANGFDIFLCHYDENEELGEIQEVIQEDIKAVRKIGEQLRGRGIRPWLAGWEVPPGRIWQRELEKLINNIEIIAVCVGKSGISPWQQKTIEALLRKCVNQQCIIIPVLLKEAPGVPQLPVFLEGHRWVDFRYAEPGSRAEADALDQLIWGIKGKKPDD